MGWLRSVLRHQSSQPVDPPVGLDRPRFPLRSGDKESVSTRQSRGLEQFFGFFRGQAGLAMLDLGSACQENVNFITNLGHRFYAEDFLRLFEESFAEDQSDQSNPGRIDYFLRQSLDYPDEHFDGVMAWDVLEYLDPPLLAATVDRLLRVTKPGGYLLAFFHSADRVDSVPYYAFRIQDLRTLQVGESGIRFTPHMFNNRGLEKLFQKSEWIKLFLTRDRLREVLVRR
jgi:hypothetical protein